MGNKIITEKDFWVCTLGTTPAQLQSRQTPHLVKTESGHKYITVADTATSSWIDFGCKKLMWIMAILVAFIAVAVVATGGAALGALIAAGAAAGAGGALLGAFVGALICGQKAAVARKWLSSKPDLIIKGQQAITGGDMMKCMLFGADITFAPEIKNWWQAISLGASKYILGFLEGMMYGAAVGAAGGILSGGPAVLAEFGPSNLAANWLATWTTGGGLALRGLVTTQSVLESYGETGKVTPQDVVFSGVLGMETGTGHSALKILTGHGTMDDVIGLALWFTPAHGRNRNEKSRTKGKSERGKSEEGRDEENLKAGTGESNTPRKQGEYKAYEEGRGLEKRGYRPKPGERSMTREQWKAQQSRARAMRAVSQADRPLENPNPNAARHGHGHADHGYQTTHAQQETRVQTGETPSGRKRPDGSNPPRPSRASRFDSPEAEAEALGRARKQLGNDLRNGQVQQYTDPITGQPTYVNPADGSPVRTDPIIVTTNRPGGFGSDSVVPQRIPGSNQYATDAAGNRIPQTDPAPLTKAKSVYEYVPSTGEWHPVTYYPEP